jgi:hypothetical protein
MLQILQVTKEINVSIIVSRGAVSMECGTVVTENVSVNTAPAKLLRINLLTPELLFF